MSYALYTMCDDKYVEPTSVMIYSFLDNNDWFNGDIIVLYDVLSHKNKVKLKTLYDNIIFKQVNNETYKNIMENVKGVTATSLLKCYYKYELFKDQNYDTVMWVDGDMVFNGSIEDLIKKEDTDFCWCEDKSSLGKKEYFNTGFFFFKNIDSVRNGDFYKDIFSFTENIKSVEFTNNNTYKGLFADQDVFNEKVPKYFNNIKIAPALIYNFPQQVDSLDLFNISKIVHYCGANKPFSEKINKKYISHSLWYYYYYQLNR